MLYMYKKKDKKREENFLLIINYPILTQVLSRKLNFKTDFLTTNIKKYHICSN